jgi:hypothetical protein
VNIRRVDSTGHAVQVGLVPGNRKRDGRILENAEVERVSRVLPEVVCIDQNVFPDRLLESDIVLISDSGMDSGREAYPERERRWDRARPLFSLPDLRVLACIRFSAYPQETGP